MKSKSPNPWASFTPHLCKSLSNLPKAQDQTTQGNGLEASSTLGRQFKSCSLPNVVLAVFSGTQESGKSEFTQEVPNDLKHPVAEKLSVLVNLLSLMRCQRTPPPVVSLSKRWHKGQQMVAASVFMQIARDLPLNPIALTPIQEWTTLKSDF